MQEKNKTANIVVSKNAGQITGHLGASLGTLRIYIASPCYRLAYSSTFVISLVNLLSSWRGRVNFRFNATDAADIELSRNFLLTQFYYHKQDCSHILFLDNDMGFGASLINRMIRLNESVVGVIYPGPQIDLKKFHEDADQPYEKAIAGAVEFPAHSSTMQHDKAGFYQVDSVGGGILLVSRDCVSRMIQACPEIIDNNTDKYPPHVRQLDTFLTPFDKIRTDTEWLADVDAFCHRWVKQCGGRIYANVDSKVRHTGSLALETCYEDLLQ